MAADFTFRTDRCARCGCPAEDHVAEDRDDFSGSLETIRVRAYARACRCGCLDLEVVLPERQPPRMLREGAPIPPQTTVHHALRPTERTPECCGFVMKPRLGGWICYRCERHEALNGRRSRAQWWAETDAERAARWALPPEEPTVPPGMTATSPASPPCDCGCAHVEHTDAARSARARRMLGGFEFDGDECRACSCAGYRPQSGAPRMHACDPPRFTATPSSPLPRADVSAGEVVVAVGANGERDVIGGHTTLAEVARWKAEGRKFYKMNLRPLDLLAPLVPPTFRSTGEGDADLRSRASWAYDATPPRQIGPYQHVAMVDLAPEPLRDPDELARALLATSSLRDQLPAWAELPEAARDAWRRAAEAVRTEVRDGRAQIADGARIREVAALAYQRVVEAQAERARLEHLAACMAAAEIVLEIMLVCGLILVRYCSDDGMALRSALLELDLDGPPAPYVPPAGESRDAAPEPGVMNDLLELD